MNNFEGTLVFTKNITGALSAGPERAQQVLDEFDTIQPSVAFYGEAYRVDQPHGWQEWFMDALRERGYVVLGAQYTEQIDGHKVREDEHGFVAAVRAEHGNRLSLAQYAGRSAVIMEVFDEGALRPVRMIGLHANDLGPQRRAEIDAFMSDETNNPKWGQPLALLGDVNSSAYQDLFTEGLARTGKTVERAAMRGWLHPAAPGVKNPSVLGRLWSLMLRGGQQASGTEIAKLEAFGFTDADQTRQPTAMVPKLPERLLRVLRPIRPIMRWLSRPHLQNDHLMSANGHFEGYTRHTPSPGDEHIGVSARYFADATLPWTGQLPDFPSGRSQTPYGEVS